jgi:hypothetical protein
VKQQREKQMTTKIREHFQYCTQKYPDDSILWNMARAVIRANKDQGDFVSLQEALDIAKEIIAKELK